MPDTIQPVEGFEGVLKSYTEEQLQAVQEKAAVLMRTDPDLNKICSVLIASRQLYALARYALHRELTTEGIEWDDGVEEFLIKAMADRATKPFSRTETLKILASTVKKFMTDEVNLESELERTQELIASQRDYDLRTRRIVIGQRMWGQTGDVFIVVGTADEVQKHVDLLASADTTNTYLDEEDIKKAKTLNLDVCARVILRSDKSSEERPYCLTQGFDKWMGCCATSAEFTRHMAEAKDLAPFNRIDLLVVQDVEETLAQLKQKYEGIDGVFISKLSSYEDSDAKEHSS
jgi:hypothetical protein